MQRTVLVGGLLLAAALVFAFVFVASNLQRRMLFPRPPTPPGEPRLPSGGERVWLGSNMKTEAWFLRPARTDHDFPVVIFTHGNGELIDHWGPMWSQANADGVGVLLVEYPGYGRSGGSPSEASIRDTMLAAYDYVVGVPGVDRNAIVAHGRSLGGAAACALALERPLAALVLESTFTSVRAMASRFGFPGFMVLDPFDNLSAIPGIDASILVLHGQRDDMIPIAHAEALAAAAATELIRMPCGHNDCPFSWPIVKGFLDDLHLIRDPRDAIARE